MTNKQFISEIKDLTLLANINVNKLTSEQKSYLIFLIQNTLLDLCTLKIQNNNKRLKAYKDEKNWLSKFKNEII